MHHAADICVCVVPVGDLGQVVDTACVLHAACGTLSLAIFIKPLLVRAYAPHTTHDARRTTHTAPITHTWARWTDACIRFPLGGHHLTERMLELLSAKKGQPFNTLSRAEEGPVAAGQHPAHGCQNQVHPAAAAPSPAAAELERPAHLGRDRVGGRGEPPVSLPRWHRRETCPRPPPSARAGLRGTRGYLPDNLFITTMRKTSDG